MLEIYDLRFAIDALAARGEACGIAHLLTNCGPQLDKGEARLSALKYYCGSHEETIGAKAAGSKMGVKEHEGT